MEKAKPGPQPLEFKAGHYSIKAVLSGEVITLKAYSELVGKMFEAAVQADDLQEFDRGVFGDCEGVYAMIEECLVEKRKVELSDIGELSFSYSFKPNKKTEVAKTLILRLKEVEMGETQRLLMRSEHLEHVNSALETRLKQLETSHK